MNVSVKCFAQLAQDGVCDYRDSRPLKIADGARVDELIADLGYRRDDVKLIYVNHRNVSPDTMLQEGDQVALAPPTGGM